MSDETAAEPGPWAVTAQHEVGHALIGDLSGRVFRRIEWIIDGHGSRAQYLANSTQFSANDVEAKAQAVRGRLSVTVAGVVAVGIARGRTATVDDLREDPTCQDDFGQAMETAGLILGPDATEMERHSVIAEVMGECEAGLRQFDRAAHSRALVERLVELRGLQPTGLVVLDSRTFDELTGRIEALWMPGE